MGRTKLPARQGNVVSEETSDLYKFDLNLEKLPIVYNSVYNIHFFGIEKIHPFDSGKWGKVFMHLKDGGVIQDDGETYEAIEASQNDLLVVHSQNYLDSLRWSGNVGMICEIPFLALLPNFIVQRRVLRPLRTQTGGSIMAGRLAIEYGWSINIGGGFHHCSASRGGGFCAYADITLLIMFAFSHYPDLKTVLIVDLDAHQGNGHARDFMAVNKDKQVYILDVYNKYIYPRDEYAKQGITRKVEVRSGIGDDEYLSLVETNLQQMLNQHQPQLVVYNAGTDVLQGDPLGCMNITPEGVKTRDRIVFSECRQHRKIPVVMLTSGGYQRTNAQIIAESIQSLHSQQLIQLPSAALCQDLGVVT